MEADASVEATRMQKLRALAAARGCDVDEVIEEMLRNAQEPQLPLATTDTAA